MTPAVQKSIEKLEIQKRALLSDVAAWPEVKQRFRPRPQDWSALNVVDHLTKVEVSALDAVRRSLPHGSPVTVRNKIGALCVIAVMQSPIRVRVPSAASLVLPEPAAELSGIAARWQQVRGEMIALLQSLEPEQFRRGLFLHPVAGWMTIANALVFLSAHLRHHEYQLNRLKQATRAL